MSENFDYLVDTHSHLHFPDFENDLPDVIRRARQVDVRKIITLGTDYASSVQTVALANRYEGVYAAVGVHPSEAHRMKAEDIRALAELIQSEKKIVAIGEIGLDFYWEKNYADQQYRVFLQMIELAQEFDLPVVIHNRSAHREMEWFFQEQKIRRLKGVMHCFSGDQLDSRFYLEMGLYISFTGNITYRDFRKVNVVKTIPRDRLLLETDSPYLTPEPFRKQRNEPSYIPYIARKIADIWQEPLEVVARQTTENAHRLFGLAPE